MEEDALSTAPTRETSPALGPNCPKVDTVLPPSLLLNVGPPKPQPPDASSDESLAAVQAVSRTAELAELRTRRCVTSRPRPECPICLTPFDEPTYPSARASGAFECAQDAHDLCYQCAYRLLLDAVSRIEDSAQKAFRCPLCGT